MNALDDIRIRAGVDDVTEAEALAVIEWCREWVADCEWSDADEVLGADVPTLLRACNGHIDGGLAFVLADVRRTMMRDHAVETVAAELDGVELMQSCRDCGRDFPYSEDADYCPDCVRENMGEGDANFEQAERLRSLFEEIVTASRDKRHDMTNEYGRRARESDLAYRNGLMDAYVLLSGHDAEHVYEIVQDVLQARAEGAEMLAPGTLDPRD